MSIIKRRILVLFLVGSKLLTACGKKTPLSEQKPTTKNEVGTIKQKPITKNEVDTINKNQLLKTK